MVVATSVVRGCASVSLAVSITPRGGREKARTRGVKTEANSLRPGSGGVAAATYPCSTSRASPRQPLGPSRLATSPPSLAAPDALASRLAAESPPRSLPEPGDCTFGWIPLLYGDRSIDLGLARSLPASAAATAIIGSKKALIAFLCCAPTDTSGSRVKTPPRAPPYICALLHPLTSRYQLFPLLHEASTAGPCVWEDLPRCYRRRRTLWL